MIDKVEFELELPGTEETKIVKSTDLTDRQYALATQMQALQTPVQNLAASVNEYELKKDHFRLKQKELMELLEKTEIEKPQIVKKQKRLNEPATENDGSISDYRQKADST